MKGEVLKLYKTHVCKYKCLHNITVLHTENIVEVNSPWHPVSGVEQVAQLAEAAPPLAVRVEGVVVAPPEVGGEQLGVAVHPPDVVSQQLGRGEVPGVDVGVGRGDGGHVDPVQHHGDHIVAVTESLTIETLKYSQYYILLRLLLIAESEVRTSEHFNTIYRVDQERVI